MILVYCERSSRRGLWLWNGGCVSSLCISEINAVFASRTETGLATGMEQQVSITLPSNRLGDMMMVNIETQKERDILLPLTIWLLGCSIIII